MAKDTQTSNKENNTSPMVNPVLTYWCDLVHFCVAHNSALLDNNIKTLGDRSVSPVKPNKTSERPAQATYQKQSIGFSEKEQIEEEQSEEKQISLEITATPQPGIQNMITLKNSEMQQIEIPQTGGERLLFSGKPLLTANSDISEKKFQHKINIFYKIGYEYALQIMTFRYDNSYEEVSHGFICNSLNELYNVIETYDTSIALAFWENVERSSQSEKPDLDILQYKMKALILKESYQALIADVLYEVDKILGQPS